MISRAVIVATCAALVLGVVGCDKLMSPGKGPFQTIDVTGSGMGGELNLTGHDGKPRTLADFRGKLVVISFGFTNCPDVCPTTLADLAAAMKILDKDANAVQVVFVTVDPKRDTQQLLSQYVPAFDPTFIGLYGDEAATARVTKSFHVFAQERPGKTPGDYAVDHSAQSFVLDREGRVRLLISPGTAPAAIAADLRVLLNNA